MSFKQKTAAVALLLIAFTLWPIVHHAIAKRHFVNPWRLFGWAMYCVPIYRPQVRFFTTEGDQRLEIAYPRVSRDNVLAYERFLGLRPQLGTLIEPEGLGQAFFRQYPDLDRVIVHITQPVYHYDSDQIRQAYFEYTFERLD